MKNNMFDRGKVYVYFDQGGMFSRGIVFISEERLPSNLKEENDISNFFFCELESYYGKSCLSITLNCFGEKYGLYFLKDSLRYPIKEDQNHDR